ncbi:MAG: NUDIX domain-containing protein [Trebonia sp.]
MRSGPPTRTSGGRPPGGLLPRDERYWLTIGGGKALGETLAQAGAREMREEAGIDVPPAALGEPLGTTVIRYAAFGLVPVTQYQTYFAVAVDDYGGSSPRETCGSWRAIRWRILPSRAMNREVRPRHQSLIERLGIDGHEWLTADELERRPERLADLAMPRLMRAAVAAVRGRADRG